MFEAAKSIASNWRAEVLELQIAPQRISVAGHL
jgi:hypothetical protein